MSEIIEIYHQNVRKIVAAPIKVCKSDEKGRFRVFFPNVLNHELNLKL